jgi:cytidylate kinase
MIIKGGYEKARVYIETRTKAVQDSQTARTEYRTGPCITISREAGAGSGIISEKLINDLQSLTKDENAKWSIFDKNIIEKILEDHNQPDSLFGYYTEEKKSKLVASINELFGLQPPTAIIVKQTTETILKIANMGYSIIVGRGASIITSKLHNVINIRLISTMEDRVARIREVYGWCIKDAQDFIKNEDLNRREYIQNTFHKRIDDPQYYHLIINSHLLKPEEASDTICNLVRKRFPELLR